jgi:peroxiredoxin
MVAILEIDQTAPGFSLRGIDDKIYALNQHDARLTLVVFFKTTCPTCMLAFPYIEKIQRAYRDAGLAVWGIAQDAREPSAEFARAYGATFAILTDADLRVARVYDPEFVPTTFLIDRAGKIIERVIAFNKIELNRVAKVIAEKLNAPVALTAPDNDGNPPFKPG